MELWDIYDIDRVRTGRVAQRGKPASEGGLGEGEYHLVVHICVFNGRGQLLLQQRQKDKEGYPNLWDVSAAGSALAGENSAAAASRELREELGLVHDFTKERPFLTTHFERGFDDWYFIRIEANINDLRLQPEEVQDAKWADLAEIERMLDSGEMVPYYRDLVRLWFVMKDHRGSTMNVYTHVTSEWLQREMVSIQEMPVLTPILTPLSRELA